jgi:hypothetical protein
MVTDQERWLWMMSASVLVLVLLRADVCVVLIGCRVA